MFINAVNHPSFEGKQRFLSKTGHENLKEILKNINAETTMKKNVFCWSSEFIKSVALKDEKLKLIDKRMFLDKRRCVGLFPDTGSRRDVHPSIPVRCGFYSQGSENGCISTAMVGCVL